MADERDGAGRLTLSVMRVAVCLIGCALACDRGRAADPPPAAAPAPAPVPVRSSCTLAPLPLRRPAVRRVVAIGDLHGDVDAARDALRTAGAIDDRAHWGGGCLLYTSDAAD